MNDINFNLRLQHLQNNILPYTLINLIGNQDGNGFLIKGYFITAGHCLSCGSVSFIYNKTKYTFKKEDAIFFLSDIDSSEIPMGDIAIFKFENNDKYLEVAPNSYELENSTKLILPHYIHETWNTQNIFINNEKIYLGVDSFIFNSVIKDAPNFFESSTTSLIKEGSSGSPLLNENFEIVGILVGCLRPNEKPNMILFNDIRQFINRLT